MQIPYELALGWRYTRAGRATRRNGFISFISGVSMLGIALGVAALIIVLSVMNGFQKEVRDRMLSVVSHIEIFAPHGAAMPDPARTLAEAQRNPNVVGAAPFVSAQALLARGEDMKGTLVRGIDPDKEGVTVDDYINLVDFPGIELDSGIIDRVADTLKGKRGYARLSAELRKLPKGKRDSLRKLTKEQGDKIMAANKAGLLEVYSLSWRRAARLASLAFTERL